jgi:hypothetical protein
VTAGSTADRKLNPHHDVAESPAGGVAVFSFVTPAYQTQTPCLVLIHLMNQHHSLPESFGCPIHLAQHRHSAASNAAKSNASVYQPIQEYAVVT